MPPISYSDIEALKSFSKTVTLDRYFHAKVKLLVNRMREKVMIDEHASEMDWQRRVQAGEIVMTSPEYNARVLSPRSEVTAKKLLVRFAVYEWIKAGMPNSAPPVVTDRHFDQLEDFFLEISSSTRHLERVMRQYAPGSAEHQEFKLIVNSRAEYERVTSKLESEIAQSKDIQALQRFAKDIGLGWEALIGVTPMPAPHGSVKNENAEAVRDFLSWRDGLLADIKNRGVIEEVTPNDVAQDKALYLANRLLNYIKQG